MEKPSPEDDMKDYGQELSGIEKPTIDDIIAISMNYVPEKFRNAPWMNTGHGIRIYENDGELACYIAAYGEMHKRKMEKILDDFPYEDIDAPFEIVDWGVRTGTGHDMSYRPPQGERIALQTEVRDTCRAVMCGDSQG